MAHTGLSVGVFKRIRFPLNQAKSRGSKNRHTWQKLDPPQAKGEAFFFSRGFPFNPGNPNWLRFSLWFPFRNPPDNIHIETGFFLASKKVDTGLSLPKQSRSRFSLVVFLQTPNKNTGFSWWFSLNIPKSRFCFLAVFLEDQAKKHEKHPLPKKKTSAPPSRPSARGRAAGAGGQGPARGQAPHRPPLRRGRGRIGSPGPPASANFCLASANSEALSSSWGGAP